MDSFRRCLGLAYPHQSPLVVTGAPRRELAQLETMLCAVGSHPLAQAKMVGENKIEDFKWPALKAMRITTA